MKPVKGTFALVLVLLTAGCVRKNDADDGPNAAAARPSQLPAGQVRLTAEQQTASGVAVGAAELRPLADVLVTTAQIEIPTGRSAQAVAPVAGYVELPPSGIPAIGSRLERGRTIAIVRQAYSASDRLQMQVNLQDAEASLKAADAQRGLAQSQLDRSHRLYRDKIAPLKQVQQDEAAVKAAEIAYQSAAERIANYRGALVSDTPQGGAGPAQFVVAAPISGTVVAADLASGAMVDPARPLLSIVDTSVVWVKAPVPEAELGFVARSGSGELTVPAYPDRRFPLRRVASPTVVDPATHTATFLYEIANPRGELKPGMAATVRLVSSQTAPRVTVPEAALLQEAGSTVVFVQVAADTFQSQPVVVVFRNQGQAAIGSGLAAGQKLAVSGASVLESQLQKGRIQTSE